MVKLRIKDVEFSYGSNPVLEGVSFDVNDGEILGIIGPNGAGKSTLLRCMNRILKVRKGVIMIDGKNISDFSRIELARIMGYVPQSTHQIFPNTVFDTILMGRRPHLGWKCGEIDIKKVLETIEMLNIVDLAMRDITELSGGQQQKVFIARALAQEPEVLILDEPTSNLDIKHQLEVMNIISKIVKERGITAVMAVHDLNLASRYVDRIIMMHAGKIFAVGNPSDVLTEENIRKVYGVEAIVGEHDGRPFILPIRPADTGTHDS
ncbi:MAG: ABC transporter ATP-binding protein [Canidatus Methanoxibalbensis ujae]|nr:ABC transporter ATP-binding protein [Candidatus Methanoxibalbensis ujae]